MLSQRKYELEHIKMRKKQHMNTEVQETAEETENGNNLEAEEVENGNDLETEQTGNGDNLEAENVQNDKITELEEQLDTYRLEYASTLLEKAGIGGENYHALNLIDMTSKDTIQEDVERLVEICKNYNTGTYSNDINSGSMNAENNEIKSKDDLMQKTFGTGKWRGKPWL